jgi:hypothetical protein
VVNRLTVCAHPTPLSHMGLSVHVWGPSAWQWLHTVAWQTELESDPQRVRAHAFVLHFVDHVPCATCREHFRQILKEDGTLEDGGAASAFASDDAFRRATVSWHNAVNARLGKPLWTYERAQVTYDDLAPGHASSSRCAVVAGVALLTGALCLVLFRGKRPRLVPPSSTATVAV